MSFIKQKCKIVVAFENLSICCFFTVGSCDEHCSLFCHILCTKHVIDKSEECNDLKRIGSCSPKNCFSTGTAPPPVNPMAPHTYQPSRAPYGPPPTGPPPTLKPTPPPTGPPMANATPPPPGADGKFMFIYILHCLINFERFEKKVEPVFRVTT